MLPFSRFVHDSLRRFPESSNPKLFEILIYMVCSLGGALLGGVDLTVGIKQKIKRHFG
jgi:hypothetical protein